MTPLRVLLTELIRGGDKTTPEEIGGHLERLAKLGHAPIEEWEHWPSELRAMEREGLVRREGEGWLVWVYPKKQEERLLWQ